MADPLKPDRPLARGLALAVLASAVVLLLRYSINDLMDGQMPLMAGMFAVIVAAWYGGLWPGLLATLFCAVCGVALFVDGGWGHLAFGERLLLAGFLTLGGVTSLLFEALHAAHARLGASRFELSWAREQRERSQRQTRDAELQRRLVVEASFDALYDWDVASDRMVWNQGIGALFGYAGDATCDRAWWSERIHPADRERTLESLHAALSARREKWSSEYRFRRADGEHVWVLDRAGLVFDREERTVRVVGAMQDISDRWRAAEALAHFKSLFEAQPAPVLVVDPELRIAAASDSFLTATGTLRAEIVGRPLFETFPDDADGACSGPFRAAFEKVLATGRPEQLPVLPYAVPSPQGGMQRRWWSTYHFPVLGPRGDVAFVVQRADDVTETLCEQASPGDVATVQIRAETRVRDVGNLEHAHLLAEANRRLGVVNARLALFAELAEATRALLEPQAIVDLVVDRLGRHLAVDRCIWTEGSDDGANLAVVGDYPGRVGPAREPGGPSALALGFQGLSGAASTCVTNDVETDPDARPRLPLYRAEQVRASIVVPLHRNGRVIATLAVFQRLPREWTGDEIQTVEQVAERCQQTLERARAVSAVTASEQQLRGLIEAMPAKVGTLATDGRVLYLHPSWTEYTGLSFEEISGEQCARLFHPEDLPEYRRRLDACLASGEPCAAELRVRHHDGEFRWHLARLAPVRDALGGIRSWVSAVTEIHELKMANEHLRFLAALSQTIQPLADPVEIARTVCSGVASRLRVSRCVYLDIDPDAAHYDVIAESCEGVGSRLGRHSFGVFGAASRRELEQGRSLVIRDVTGAAGIGVDVEAAREAGVGALVLVPLHGDGRLVGGFAVHHRTPRDWTEAEIEAVDLAANLCFESMKRARSAVQEAASHEHLRRADRAKDEFLATLAHELRNPIAPISNGVQLLQLAGEDPKLRGRMLEVMSRQLSQMVRLVDDLLDVSRITTGKLVLQRGATPLAEVLRNAVESVDALIRAGGHRLELALPEEEIVLDCDAARLAQVLTNLLTNSAKYSEQPGTIRLEAARCGDELRLTVRDEGIGIAADVLPRVFEMFAQSDRALSRSQGGLGIGLSLVRQLVELHGGRVTAASDGPGCGSTFTVYLPLECRDRPPPPSVGPMIDRRKLATRRRVLVADDNEDSAQSLAALLRVWGHDVVIAPDGVVALERAAEFRPDAMVLDLGMPRCDGLATARAARDQPWGGEVRLIALSGWGQAEDRARTRAAGFDHHLVKPVDGAVLQKLLEQAPTAQAGSG